MTQTTKPLAKYRHARGWKDFVFLAGQGARDPATNAVVGLQRDASGKVVAHDVTAQTRQVFSNIEAVLDTIARGKEHIVDVTVFLRDMRDFDAMNAVWNEFFADGDAPTRTTVAVLDLPFENFVEMKAIVER